MNAVCGDDDGCREPASVARRELDAFLGHRRLNNLGTSHQFGARRDGEPDQERVELEPPDHECGGLSRLDERRFASWTLEVQAAQEVGVDTADLTLEVRKAAKDPDTDPASARLVSGERRAVEK